MKRNEFILKAFKESKCYWKSKWVFSLFTVVRDREIEKNTDPQEFDIGVKDNHYVFYYNGEWIDIEDAIDVSIPLYRVEDTVYINQSSDIIQKHSEYPFKTRAGNLFVNYYCLVSAFGNKIDYFNGKFTISNMESKVAKLISDEPNLPPDSPYVTPAQVKRFSSACASLGGFSSIAVPSATAYTMVPAEGITEYRDKLLEEYKDKLHDPATIALIDSKLVEYDKQFQSNDPEGGFLTGTGGDKLYTVARKRLFSMHGLEQTEMSGGKGTLINKSLSETRDIEHFPALNDSLRDGSYNRGAMTALGGEAVKFIFRIFSTTSATSEDCGTTLGNPIILTENNIKNYIGSTIILPMNKQVKLTNENYKDYLNKNVMVRGPGFCREKHANFCFTCMGERLRPYGKSLSALASNVGSAMLYVFMKKMHGTTLKTAKWNFKETIK